MGRGDVWPSEMRVLVDAETGAHVRQLTDHPSIHHHPFYYLPAWDDAMQHLIVVAHRTGRPEVYALEWDSGRLRQLTDQPDVSEWSVHPSHDGRYVYFTAGSGAWRVCIADCSAERLVDFRDAAMREAGMVGAAMGTTSLSHNDRWWAVPVKVGTVSRLAIIDTSSGTHEVILERNSIGHPEFHPSDDTLLRYAGPWTDRMWVIRRDGSGNRLAYARDAAAKEWIVHETWRPGTRELLVTRWPHGMIGVDADSGAVRHVCAFNAWHASINRQGTLMCADTTYPDRGLILFDPRDGLGTPHTLCFPRSSNVGAHWNTDHCPYDDGVRNVYAPQHTHPHPAFSPDGRWVAYTSDRDGFAQVYCVQVPEGLDQEGSQ